MKKARYEIQDHACAECDPGATRDCYTINDRRTDICKFCKCFYCTRKYCIPAKRNPIMGGK